MHQKIKSSTSLITQDEIDKFFLDTDHFFSNVLKDNQLGPLSSYTLSQAREIRNTLLAVGSVRLARRSQEMISMTMEEVQAAELKIVDDQQFYRINVGRHKTRKKLHGRYYYVHCS